MKKILAFVLTLSLALAMFSGITAFAAGELTITSTYTDAFRQLKSAIADPDGPDVIVIDTNFVSFESTITVDRAVEIRAAGGRTSYLTADDSGNPAITGPHFVITSAGSLTLDGFIVRGMASNTKVKGGISVDGGTLIAKNTTFTGIRAQVPYPYAAKGAAIEAINGAFVDVSNCKFTEHKSTSLSMTGAILATTGSELIIRNSEFSGDVLGILADGTVDVWFEGDISIVSTTSPSTAIETWGLKLWNDTSDINWEVNGLDKRPGSIDPPDDPTAPTGTDKVNGNTGIEITADPPTLIDPADPYVATIFDAGYIGGSDLWFGTHLASSEPQELPSIDNGEGKGSIISLVTYNQHKVNGIYGIKGQIGIFARNDEAKTPVIEDFSLSLEATTTKWCKDDDSAFVPKYTAHNITSGFAMGPNEDPLTLFDTDTVGYMLSDYKGVLTLPADAVLATGVATAVMTWTIEAEVI